MTFAQRLKKLGFSLVMFVVAWLAFMAWEARGMPPREELEGLVQSFGFAFALLVVVEAVIHLVRRSRT